MEDDRTVDPLIVNKWRRQVLNVNILDSSPDFIAKNISERTHPRLNAVISETFKPISMVDLLNLPRSCSYLKYDPETKARKPLELLRRKTVHSISSINHLYKEALVVTTAPYKLLSCLNFLIERQAFLGIKVKNILCCGDGTGGYSAVLSQIYRSAKNPIQQLIPS